MPTNPYIGPRPFEPGQKLYGREAECRDLLRLLSAERLVLLHSPSGAGKTSLIQAGLLPEAQKRFTILPIIRVNTPLDPTLPPDTNRYLASTFLSLEKNQTEATAKNLDTLTRSGLEAYLAGRDTVVQALTGQIGRAQARWLLIFDQFEEILTLNPNDLAAKHAFFKELGQALEDRRIWAIFVMREDYVAALEPYRPYFPNQLSTRFRLDLLGRPAALTAIETPAREAGVTFAPNVAQQLVDDLCQVQVQQPDGSITVEPGPYVEPVQLQVVCHRLWNALPAGATTIDAAQLAAVGSVNEALGAYYDEKLEAAAAEAGYNPGLVRRWVDRHLITPAGFRSQVLQEQGPQWEQFNRAVKALIDAYLVREEKRRGATWLELAHDRLVKPVQAANKRWYEAHPTDLPTRAALWDETGRPDGLLLQEAALRQAQKESRARTLSAQEAAFVAASQRAVQHARDEHLRRRWVLVFGVLSAITALVVAGLAWWAFRLRDEAVAQTRVATARQLIAAATNKLDSRLDEGFLYSIEAYNAAPELGEGRALLLNALQTAPRLQRLVQFSLNKVATLAVSPANNVLAVAGCTPLADDQCGQYQLALWDLNAQTVLTTVAGLPAPISSLAFTDTLLVVGDETGAVRFWDLTTPAQPQALGQAWQPYPHAITSLALNATGSLLAVGSQAGQTSVWAVTQSSPPQLLTQSTQHTRTVTDLAFNPDGSALVVGNEDGSLDLWEIHDLDHPQVTTLFTHTAPIKTVAFSPDGLKLATGTSDGKTLLWPVAPRRPEIGPAPGAGAEATPSAPQSISLSSGFSNILSVAFSPSGEALAVGGCGEVVPSAGASDGCLKESQILLWELSANAITVTDTTQERPFVLRSKLTGHNALLTGLAFDATGNTLVSADAAGSVFLWQSGLASTAAMLAKTLQTKPTAVNALAFAPDNQTLAVGSADATIGLWNINTLTLSETLKAHTDQVTGVAFDPTGTLLASSSADGQVLLWDVATGTVAHTLTGHTGTVLSVAFDPTGQWVVSGGQDTTARVWEVKTGQLLYTLTGHTGEVTSVAFNPAGTLLATGGGQNDATVRLWRFTPGSAPTLLGSPLAGLQYIFSVAFSPDDPMLYASDADGTLHQWEIVDPTAPQDKTTHEQSRAGRVIYLALNPQAQVLAVSDNEGGLFLRDLSYNLSEMGNGFSGHAEPVLSLAFSPDGQWLASGDEGGHVFLWLGSPNTWQTQLCQMAGRNFTQAEWTNNFHDEAYHTTCAQWPAGE